MKQYLIPGICTLGVLFAPIAYASEDSPKLVDKATCEKSTGNEKDLICIKNLEQFVAMYDVKGEAADSPPDQRLYAYDIVASEIRGKLDNTELNAEDFKVKEMAITHYILMLTRTMQKRIITPLDINGDGYVSKADDVNGDNMITSEDKKLYESKKKKERKK